MKRTLPILTAVSLAFLIILLMWTAVVAERSQRLLSPNLYGYVGASTTDDLAIFELSSNNLITPPISLLPEGNYPYDVTLNPDGSQVWIAGASGEGVVVVDTAGNTVVTSIPNLGDYPVDVLFGVDGSLAYVSNRDTVDDIAVIDTSSYSLVYTITVPNASLGPGKMALNHCSGEIYAVNWYDDHLYYINPISQTVTSDITMGVSMWDLTIDPTATTLYIADRGLDQVHVFDIASQTPGPSINVGADPWGIDITPDGHFVFVANEDSHDVSVIDTTLNVVTTTIPLAADADPRDLDITADGQYVYVTSGEIAGDDVVYVIEVSSLSVVDTIFVAPSANPNALAVAPNFASLNPTAAFTYTTPVTAGVPVQFTDQSTNNPTNWAWDFGDGGTSTEQNPTYTYNAAGTYTVTLTVSNNCGVMNSTSMPVIVETGAHTVYLPVALKEE